MNYHFSPDAAEATAYLVATLKQLLETGQKVLWLVSGGSGGKVTVQVAQQLQDTPLANLYVALSDERYGEIGHADENWQQLLDDGFSLPGATLYRTLNGSSRTETAKALEAWLRQTKATVDYTIGLFGIGSDGHTAGIKPASPAVTFDSLVTEYSGEDFERITITPAFIETIDEAVTQAFGSDKFPVIAELLHTEKEFKAQPAQILKRIPKSTLYTDYKEN